MFQWRPKKGMYEGIVVPTALYGSEAWMLENKVKNRMDVTEMSCLRSMCGVTRRDRVRNEEIRRRCGLQLFHKTCFTLDHLRRPPPNNTSPLSPIFYALFSFWNA